jgi:hypothetical protein
MRYNDEVGLCLIFDYFACADDAFLSSTILTCCDVGFSWRFTNCSAEATGS